MTSLLRHSAGVTSLAHASVRVPLCIGHCQCTRNLHLSRSIQQCQPTVTGDAAGGAAGAAGAGGGGVALLVCDLQERFRRHVPHFAAVAQAAGVLVAAAQLLQLPVLVTEQNPRALGATAAEVGVQRHQLQPPLHKTCFSMCDRRVQRWLQNGGRHVDDVEGEGGQVTGPGRSDAILAAAATVTVPIHTVLLCGLETHVCILHTVRDLLKPAPLVAPLSPSSAHCQQQLQQQQQLQLSPQRAGYTVHVVADACSSRRPLDRLLALQQLRQLGAVVTSVEAAVLGLVSDSRHPLFRQLQLLIREPLPDTGLLQLLSHSPL